MSVLGLDALRMHGNNGGVDYVAGPRDGVWCRADLALADADLEDDGAERLAILASALPEEPWRVDAIIRRVHDRGYGALAVLGAAALGRGARVLAERLGLTLLDVERPFVLAECCWQLTLDRDALTLDVVRRLAVAFRYPANGLADLLAHLSSATGCGIALLDVTGVIEQAGGDIGDAHWGIDTDRWVDLCTADGVSVASVRVDSPSRPGLRLAFFGEGVRQSQLLALSVAAEVTMPAVAARILIDEVDAVNDASISSTLLRDFLDQRGVFDSAIATRMHERGWRVGGHHLGFTAIPRSRVDARGLLRAVVTGLASIEVESHATTLGRGVTGWLRFPAAPSARDLQDYVAALRGLHEGVRKNFNVATGVGSLHPGAEGLGATLGEASDAARIASDRSATGWFVRVDGLGLDQLLLARTENDTFMPAAQSLLAPLRGEDDALLQTLLTFLDHESGLAATAAALGVHRNTVAARMQRVQEILGVDMHDSGVRLALHLACRAVLR